MMTRLLETLRAIVATANSCEVDLVLIAGDLFDSARVPDTVADLVTAALGRCGRPVVRDARGIMTVSTSNPSTIGSI